jgi:hypothetical protein
VKPTYDPLAVRWCCLLDLLRQGVRDRAPNGNRRLGLKLLIPIPLNVADNDTSPEWIWNSPSIDLVSDYLRRRESGGGTDP